MIGAHGAEINLSPCHVSRSCSLHVIRPQLHFRTPLYGRKPPFKAGQRRIEVASSSFNAQSYSRAANKLWQQPLECRAETRCRAKAESSKRRAKAQEPADPATDAYQDAEEAVGTAGLEASGDYDEHLEEAAERPDALVHQLVAPAPPASSGASFTRVGVIGAIALVSGISLFFVIRKLAAGQLPQVQEALDQRKLQKESTERLNGFMEELRNDVSAELSAKNLGDEGCAYIAEGLAFNDRCLTADLSKNGIGIKGSTQLCQALSNNHSLQHLILDTNNFGDEGAELLARIIATNTSLKSLNVSSNNIGDKGATLLAEALKLNTTLTKLELSGNSIDYDGAAALAEALAQNTSLQALSISDNYIGALGAGMLAKALLQNKSLRELHIKGNQLGDEGIKVLCDAFRDRKSPVACLDFGNNSMTAEGAEALAVLVKVAKIKELSLYMNDMGDTGMYKLAEALKGDDSLTSLDVNGNNIGPEGITVLANALKGHQNLRTLELGYNPIQSKGAKALVDIFKFDLQVETLKMGWCKLGKTDGAAAAADLIMFNTSLHTLDLRGNGFENNGAILLSRALKEHSNEHLQELDLGYNEIKDEGACQLAQALKANAVYAPSSLKVNANYITRFGQTALVEALDTVYEIGGQKEINITF